MCYVVQWGGGGVGAIQISADQRYKGAQSNVVHVARGWGLGCLISRKKA